MKKKLHAGFTTGTAAAAAETRRPEVRNTAAGRQIAAAPSTVCVAGTRGPRRGADPRAGRRNRIATRPPGPR